MWQRLHATCNPHASFLNKLRFVGLTAPEVGCECGATEREGEAGWAAACWHIAKTDLVGWCRRTNWQYQHSGERVVRKHGSHQKVSRCVALHLSFNTLSPLFLYPVSLLSLLDYWPSASSFISLFTSLSLWIHFDHSSHTLLSFFIDPLLIRCTPLVHAFSILRPLLTAIDDSITDHLHPALLCWAVIVNSCISDLSQFHTYISLDRMSCAY